MDNPQKSQAHHHTRSLSYLGRYHGTLLNLSMHIPVHLSDANHVDLGSLFDARSMSFLVASRRATALLDGTGAAAARCRTRCPHTDYELVVDTCTSGMDRVASGNVAVEIELLLTKIRQACEVSVREHCVQRQERVSLVWRARTCMVAAEAVAGCVIPDYDLADATHVVTAVTYVATAAVACVCACVRVCVTNALES